MKKRNTMFEHDIYILLFITNAVAMLMELVAARILSPLSGSSNTVWTVIITMMLLANAVGNFWGGKLSDKYELSVLKIILLFIAGVSTLFIALVNGQVLNFIGNFKADNTLGIVIFEIFLFLIPCIAIGAFSPVVNKAELTDNENMGKKSGVIYTVITVGSLFGTVFGGLFLIPRLGCTDILYGTALFLMVYAFIYAVAYKSKITVIAGATTIASFILMFTLTNVNDNNSMILIDTDENYVRIYDAVKDGDPIRIFSVGGGYSSACYIDPNKRNELVFKYTQAYDRVFDKFNEADDILMLGGAGYSYPRHIISHYDDKTIDVVEIDGGVTEAAKKYFYLQDFIDEYGADRLNLYTDDARIYLQNTEKKYDVVMNDCFTGHCPARALSTTEACELIKSHLSDNGIYVTNIANVNTKFFSSEIKTVMTVFDYVWIQPADEENLQNNWLIFASDYDYGFDSRHVMIKDDDIVFTDDYAPVEVFSDTYNDIVV